MPRNALKEATCKKTGAQSQDEQAAATPAGRRTGGRRVLTPRSGASIVPRAIHQFSINVSRARESWRLKSTHAPISVVVVAKNEADRIGALLASCAFAAEVIVVDSGSTDGTQAICEQAGATVIFNPWPGYVAQKQFAMGLAGSEWILSLDADESVSEALVQEMQAAVSQATPDVHGFSMPRKSKYLGRWILHGGWYPDRKLRLIRKGKGVWRGEDPHDRLEVDGAVHPLTHPILHQVYRHIADHVTTINNFSDIYAKQRPRKNAWYVILGIPHAVGKILESYIWKLGFLDGIPVLIIALNSAWYIFLKHAKSWEPAPRSPRL